MYYSLALLSGIIITLQLTINSELSKKIGLINSTFANFFTAFILLVFPFILQKNINSHILYSQLPLYLYLGGSIAITVTLASNYLIPKIPLIYSTIFVFLGQMSASLLVDYISGYTFSFSKIIGISFISIGIISLICFDYKKLTKTHKS